MKSKKTTTSNECNLAIIDIADSESSTSGIFIPLSITQFFKELRFQEKKFNAKGINRSLDPLDGGWDRKIMLKKIKEAVLRKAKMKDNLHRLCLGGPVYTLPYEKDYPKNALALIMSSEQKEVINILYGLGYLDLLAAADDRVRYEATVMVKPSNSGLVIASLPIIMEHDSNLPKGNSTIARFSPLDYFFLTSEAKYHLNICPHDPVVIAGIKPIEKFRQ
ncbi:MAG: hypothetical protein Q7R95_02705 [bacterium]|nr:hypothetical protein [bacterium]